MLNLFPNLTLTLNAADQLVKNASQEYREAERERRENMTAYERYDEDMRKFYKRLAD